MTRLLSIALVAASLFFPHAHAQCKDVTTAPNFDLTSYISAPWYVQQQAVNTYLPEENFYCVKASYEQKRRPTFPWRYTIGVNNVASEGSVDGNVVGGDLCAYETDSSNPAKLAVAPCFLPRIVAGDYWVIAYDEQEGYALISGGQPTIQTPEGCKTGSGINDSGLWVFSRGQQRNETLVDKVRAIAKDQGFDLSVLKNVVQEGCVYDSNRRGLRASN